MSKYLIDVRPESYDLCVFLNDGVEIETPEPRFLFVEIINPREITTKVLRMHELVDDKYADALVFKA